MPPEQTTQIRAETQRCRRKNQSDVAVDAEDALLDAADDPLDEGLLRMPCPRWPSMRAHISGVSVSDTTPLAMIDDDDRDRELAEDAARSARS